MTHMVRHVEDSLGRVWPGLLTVLVVVALVQACAASRIIKDPVTGAETVVVEGENVLPGIADVVEDVTGVPTEDIVGAVGDAVETVDIPKVAKDVSSGNWLSVILVALGAAGAVAGGIVRRRKLRKKVSSVVVDSAGDVDITASDIAAGGPGAVSGYPPSRSDRG